MPTVQDSETVALLCALITAEAPLQVGYDCKIVGDTWQAGKGPCHEASRTFGGVVEKNNGRIWTAQVSGNEIADLAAKRAVRALADHAAFSEAYLDVATVRCGYCVCRREGTAAFGRGCQSCGVRKRGSPTKTTTCEQCNNGIKTAPMCQTSGASWCESATHAPCGQGR